MNASDTRRSSGGWEQEGTLGDRDRAILSTVGTLRLTSGGQLQRLFFADTTSTGSGSTSSSNPRVARRTLQRLTDAGLLVRPARRLGGVRAGSSSYLYALTPRGGKAIGRTVSRGQRNEPSLTFVSHTLAVAETCVRLHEARRSGRLDSLRIEAEPQCWRSLDSYAGGVLKPDLFVLVAVADTEHLAFVEVDLGTEHGPALRRKAHLYEQHYRSGQEQARLGAYPVVLWLVPDQARADRLAAVLSSDKGLTPELHRVGLQDDPAGALTT